MLRKLAALAALAATLFSVATISANAEEILLRSKQSGKYVAASNGRLAATAGSASAALKLDMVRLDGNKVAFRVVSNGSYVRAGVGNGAFLASGSPHIRGWETFQLMSLGGTTHALKSVQNNKLVRAGVGQGSKLAAVSDGKPRGWEMFDIVPAAAAQSGPSNAAVSTALRGSWRILRVATIQTGHLTTLGDALSAGTRIDISAGGDLRANVGCNSITSSVTQSGGNFQSSGPIQTKMRCPDTAVMNIEQAFTAALGGAKRVAMGGDDLLIKNASGQTTLVLRKL